MRNNEESRVYSPFNSRFYSLFLPQNSLCVLSYIIGSILEFKKKNILQILSPQQLGSEISLGKKKQARQRGGRGQIKFKTSINKKEYQ